MKEFVKKNSIWLTLIPVLALMVFIFVMSSQPADESLKTSGGFVSFAEHLFYPELDSMPPAEREQIHSAVTNVVRKIGHFCEYGALGFFTFLHFDAIDQKRKIPKKGLWALLVCFLYSCSDEIHQAFVPERGPGVRDVLIDTSGALAGILVMTLLLYIVRKKHG